MSKHRYRKNAPVLGSTDSLAHDTLQLRTKSENLHDALLVNRAGLQVLNARLSLLSYLCQLWERRYFIVADARSKAFKSSRNTFLGHAWLVIQPLLDICIYAVIFGLVLKTSRGIDNFLGYLTIGAIYFGFLSTGLNAGAGLIQGSRGLIGAFSFPKAALPLASTMRQFIDNIIPGVLAILLAFAMQWPKGPSWLLVFVPILYVLLHITIFGAMLIIARITAFIPDLKALIAVITRALFFTSGIFFTLDRFAGNPAAQKIMSANPAYIYLQAFRDVTIYNRMPEASIWLQLLFWSFGLASIGLIYFWRAEERYPSVQ
jgi:teichoic acid transport system permease protein